MKNWGGYISETFEKIILVIIILAFWELAPRAGWVSQDILPSFSVVLVKFWQMLLSGEMFKNLFISLERAFGGFALSVVIGITLGFLLGWSEKVEKIIDPLMQLARNTAALALYPLFILLFGLGEVSKVAIIFWGAIWPILINTIEGVRGVDPLFVKTAYSMGASKRILFSRVILPATFPTIFTGIRLSASRSVIILVAAEMMGSSSGLGHLVFFSEANLQIAKMYCGILMLIILGVTINYVLVTLEKHVTRWKEEIVEM
ncbi:MAG: ABC transporter permease [Syntrophomonadaceae bacterium]|jgi:NitT/TauT family transport system permease protein|nr:ABC transporter permease [Syntrophomonadaceae bacterium]